MCVQWGVDFATLHTNKATSRTHSIVHTDMTCKQQKQYNVYMNQSREQLLLIYQVSWLAVSHPPCHQVITFLPSSILCRANEVRTAAPTASAPKNTIELDISTWYLDATVQRAKYKGHDAEMGKSLTYSNHVTKLYTIPGAYEDRSPHKLLTILNEW